MLARQALIKGDLVILHVRCAEVGTEVSRGFQDSPGKHEAQQGMRQHARTTDNASIGILNALFREEAQYCWAS